MSDYYPEHGVNGHSFVKLRKHPKEVSDLVTDAREDRELSRAKGFGDKFKGSHRDHTGQRRESIQVPGHCKFKGLNVLCFNK